MPKTRRPSYVVTPENERIQIYRVEPNKDDLPEGAKVWVETAEYTMQFGLQHERPHRSIILESVEPPHPDLLPKYHVWVDKDLLFDKGEFTLNSADLASADPLVMEPLVFRALLLSSNIRDTNSELTVSDYSIRHALLKDA